jgi:hypothetical protein
MLIVKGDLLNQGIKSFHEKNCVANGLKDHRFIAFSHVLYCGGIAANTGANTASSTSFFRGEGRAMELRFAHSRQYMATIVDGWKNIL